ncbi:MAG: hypothetical protein DRR42_03660 [Gammaproteobacteria bacterium]|nr:MAG: hypothetical protein DRR42_03660 [Gammaproteobacteria bacterium]
MLVSDRKKFMFVHNPKAAGSSIRNALSQYDDRDNFYWDHEDNTKLGRVLDKAHITLDDLSVYTDSSLLADYFVFGFVRNPYERVYSAFQEKNSQWDITDDTNFNTFIQTKLNEITIRFDWNFIHFCPQHYFFYQGGKCKADFIGRLENLRRDYARAINLAKLDADTDLPYLNRRSAGLSNSEETPVLSTYLDKYDPTSLSIVNRLYDRDFVYFGYDKFFSHSVEADTDKDNSHVELVYKQTRYIKGEEAFYTARIEKLSEQNMNLSEQVEATAALKGELQESRNELQASRDELNGVLQENEKMRNSRSWKITKPLRRRREWR